MARIITWQLPIDLNSLNAPDSVRECLRRCWTRRPRPSVISLLGTLTASLTRPRKTFSVDTDFQSGVAVIVEPAPSLPLSPAGFRSRGSDAHRTCADMLHSALCRDLLFSIVRDISLHQSGSTESSSGAQSQSPSSTPRSPPIGSSLASPAEVDSVSKQYISSFR